MSSSAQFDKKSKSTTRIFIGTKEVAGYLSNLQEKFKSHNFKSELILFEKARNFENFSGRHNKLIEYIQRFTFLAVNTNGVKRYFWVLAREVSSLMFLIYALNKYDVFLFFFGKSFLKANLDLPILKMFKKRIIFDVSLGSESRPLYCNGKARNLSSKAIYYQTLFKSIKYKWIEFHVNSIIASSKHAQFLRKPFIDRGNLSNPKPTINLNSIKKKDIPHFSKGFCNDGSLKILHAPSDRDAKGSDLIQQVIQSLKQEGYQIDFLEVSSVPHEQLQLLIEETDIVIDQAYSDKLMPVLAQECALQMKPVVIGGYIFEENYEELEQCSALPILCSEPNGLKDSIKSLLGSKALRKSLSNSAYNFVTSEKNNQANLNVYIAAIMNTYPLNKLTDPSKCDYIFGAGLSKEELRENLDRVCKYGGFNSLRLKKNSNYEILYRQFMSSNE